MVLPRENTNSPPHVITQTPKASRYAGKDEKEFFRAAISRPPRRHFRNTVSVSPTIPATGTNTMKDTRLLLPRSKALCADLASKAWACAHAEDCSGAGKRVRGSIPRALSSGPIRILLPALGAAPSRGRRRRRCCGRQAFYQPDGLVMMASGAADSGGTANEIRDSSKAIGHPRSGPVD